MHLYCHRRSRRNPRSCHPAAFSWKKHPFSVSGGSKVKSLPPSKKKSFQRFTKEWHLVGYVTQRREMMMVSFCSLSSSWMFPLRKPSGYSPRAPPRGNSWAKVLRDPDEPWHATGEEFWETEHLTFETRRVFRNRTGVARGFRQNTWQRMRDIQKKGLQHILKKCFT